MDDEIGTMIMFASAIGLMLLLIESPNVFLNVLNYIFSRVNAVIALGTQKTTGNNNADQTS